MRIMMEVTEKEKQLIFDHRAQERENERQSQLMHFLLDVATQYSKWLKETGAVDSFQTFYNEFEFDFGNHNKSVMYAVVVQVRKVVYESAFISMPHPYIDPADLKR